LDWAHCVVARWLPILLEGSGETSFPDLLQGRVYADFRNSEEYFDAAFDPILSLYRVPHRDPVAEDLRSALKDEPGRFTREI
jgi:hypothetical protein